MFLNGISFYDQHRDMRLDIDNMSYEVCCNYDSEVKFRSDLFCIISRNYPFFNVFVVLHIQNHLLTSDQGLIL